MKTNGERVVKAIGVALLSATVIAHGEITIGESLKLNGFIDMSAVHTSTDSDDSTTIGLDQWELDFEFNAVENISARVDIDGQPSSDQGAVEVEQAFVTVTPVENLTLKAGKFLSALGYEAAEPTAMYQYSYSATIIGYPGYANGVAAKYDAGLIKVHVAVVDGAYSSDGDAESVSPEVQLVLSPVEGLTLQAGYTVQEFDSVTNELGTVEPAYDKGIANFWAEYKVGGLTLAAEYNLLYEVKGAGSDGTGYLVMANYDWGKFGLTLRHSAVDLDNGYENSEFTVSSNYELASNLTAVFEVRFDEYEGGEEEDSTKFAAELLYVF